MIGCAGRLGDGIEQIQGGLQREAEKLGYDVAPRWTCSADQLEALA